MWVNGMAQGPMGAGKAARFAWRFAENTLYWHRARTRAPKQALFPLGNSSGPGPPTPVLFLDAPRYHRLLVLWGPRQELAATRHLRLHRQRSDPSDLRPPARISRFSRDHLRHFRSRQFQACAGSTDP